ncbi:MAG: GDSL-type esterase/lipase family protein [Phycisphaerales bacterium]
MRYFAAEAATIRMKDGSTRHLEGQAAQALYLHRNTHGLGYKRLHLLGGRNEFERSRQQQIVDRLAEAEAPGRKRVLLIGDSIRMRIRDTTGYGLHAYDRLIDHFNLTHIPHNTGGTTPVLDHLEDWLSCQPDIVHVNAGLHDLATTPRGAPPHPGHRPPEIYAKNLRQIVEVINTAGVETTIWALNTPVHDQWHTTDRKLHRLNKDVVLYNQIAAEVMAELDVPINDLFQPILEAGLEACLMRDGVHLTHTGSALLGKLVADRILGS